jgi:hypothetical protein
MKFKVGDLAICTTHQEDVTIVEVDEQRGSYLGKLVRLPDVEPFLYWEHDIEPWRYRRFVIDGNHHMKLHDCSNHFDPKFCGSGTWGVRDKMMGQVLFYITSSSSRAIAMEICKQMNEGKLLKEMLK